MGSFSDAALGAAPPSVGTKVIIKKADTVFVTQSKTLVYDVFAGEVEKTPKIKANPELPLQYEVYIYDRHKEHYLKLQPNLEFLIFLRYEILFYLEIIPILIR